MEAVTIKSSAQWRLRWISLPAQGGAFGFSVRDLTLHHENRRLHDIAKWYRRQLGGTDSPGCP